jgi:hypothetical protein
LGGGGGRRGGGDFLSSLIFWHEFEKVSMSSASAETVISPLLCNVV